MTTPYDVAEAVMESCRDAMRPEAITGASGFGNRVDQKMSKR